MTKHVLLWQFYRNSDALDLEIFFIAVRLFLFDCIIELFKTCCNNVLLVFILKWVIDDQSKHTTRVHIIFL